MVDTVVEIERPGARQVKDRFMNWEASTLPDMNEQQLLQWQHLLEHRTGIHIPEHRRSILQSSLAIRMREIGCQSYEEYLNIVKSKPSGLVEWSVLVDRLTIQETRYYRNPESLELVSNYIKNKITQNQEKPNLHLWSVGCSTGEEAYSLAIVAQNTIEQSAKPAYFGVSATDISLPALHKARAGVFDSRKLQHLSPELLDHYFEKVNDKEFLINNQIRERVNFSMLNILEVAGSPLKNMDIIYCQNVLIYFRKAMKKEILNNLVNRLAPGGLLIIGQGEITDWQNSNVARVDCNKAQAYQRIALKH